MKDLAERLIESYSKGPAAPLYDSKWPLPQNVDVVACFHRIQGLLFPGYWGGPSAGTDLAEVRRFIDREVTALRSELEQQVFLGQYHACRIKTGEGAHVDCEKCHREAEQIVAHFVESLPVLRNQLSLDLSAHYEGDPAAKDTVEVIFCYPGMLAMTAYRVAHQLVKEGSAIIPRMLTEYAHRKTGVDIHPGARIGESFFIDHGTGIVIGETTLIGDRVRIYQGVTLGAISIKKGQREIVETQKRHPTIEDDVIIYANATILGGKTVIGQSAIIGGNCWVTQSVDAGARVTVDGSTLGAR